MLASPSLTVTEHRALSKPPCISLATLPIYGYHISNNKQDRDMLSTWSVCHGDKDISLGWGDSSDCTVFVRS